MTRSPLWREFESGEGWPLIFLRWLIVLCGIAFLILAGALDLTWPQQAVLGLLLTVLAIWIDRSSSSYLVTLTLMLLSCFSTFRYGYWRISTVWKFFSDPGSSFTKLDVFFIVLLVLAECYAFIILFLGYLQTLWPLRRTPVPLPEDTELWPEIDLLIPTYNEPLNVVRYTALAAMNIDWPADKLNVYILDDGRREEFRAFAEEAGIGYMTRDDNNHAKAGNINRALQRLSAPFVAIFDSDHVPTRSFLQLTMGWFGRDAKLGLLQTPHHFYSPDPFERNLGQFRVIPNEGELFYGVVQDGNDFWNATFFCGSCAVIRRSALDEIGGIAVETVTEDAHTSLRMQIRGWNTAYINIPQAAGLATERLSGHVKQRIRWARGMVQILRIDNPLIVPGLTFFQRLCYLNAMTHFLYALPRLIFLTAPLIYLLFGHVNVPGYWAAIFAYAFPHLALSNLTNSRIQGQHRHSFWNEIYETVLAPYIFLPTMVALLNPRSGGFNVTAKGGVVNRTFFDTRIALPFLVLLFLNIAGLLAAIPRYLQFPHWNGSPAWLAWIINIPANMNDSLHPGTILMNVVWTIFNLIILSVATAVAWESQQRRQTVRVAMTVPAGIVMQDGTVIQGETSDLSNGGVMLYTTQKVSFTPGEEVRFVFPVLDGDATLPATLISIQGNYVRAHFAPLSIQEEEALTMVLYSRADTWLGWGEARDVDQPVRSLWRILQLAVHGVRHAVRGAFKRQAPARSKMATSITPLLLLVLLGLGLGLGSARSADAQKRITNAPFTPEAQPLNGQSIPTGMRLTPGQGEGIQARPVAPGKFDNLFTLADVSTPETIVLRGVDSYHSVYFAVPQTQNVKTATMRLYYHFSPGLLPMISHIKVSLNGTLFATLPVTHQLRQDTMETDLTPQQKLDSQHELNTTRMEDSALLVANLTLPAEMLIHNNELTFEFVGHYTYKCEDPSHSTLWSHVDANSQIELAGDLLPLPNDLKLLPLPFYDVAVNLHPKVPIVFTSQPSPKSLQAAGIVASWFGILTDYHPVEFPVTFGSIPQGNAIVIAENGGELPPALGGGRSGSGPTISMRTNPNDPYAKLLVLSGDSPDDILIAAQALTQQFDHLAGESEHVTLPSTIKKRQPDDAPRWLPTDHIVTIGESSQQGDLQGDGTVPVGVYSRVPPDLYYGDTQNLPFKLFYRYNGIPLANESTLQVYMNGAYVSSTPMPHTDKASADLTTVVPVPVVDMRPFSNTMNVKFVFQIAKKGYCQDTAPMNLQASIRKDSYLDITGIPHWAQLPNLEIFANAGYPFTRLADLSDTAVVMPPQPDPAEIELYLALMGHFGSQTGYPVLNVTVTDADHMGGDKDLLVLGTVDNNRQAIDKLNNRLPVRIGQNQLTIQDTRGFFDQQEHSWWKVRSSEHVPSGSLETEGGFPDALIEGIESPMSSGRSVVLVALRDKGVLPKFLEVFERYAQSSAIQQSVSVLTGDHFSSYRIGGDYYKVGSLSWVVKVRMFFKQYPWALVLVIVVICFLLALLLRAVLRRIARRRLQVV
ncbi:MAG TPA: UDP-forming cellulose synthase catalytic subunit [Acidobacteriaceae bacterium]|jgi:cellulose synthase (UDP-forming)